MPSKKCCGEEAAMLGFYKAIWRATGRRQIVLVVLSIVVGGLAAVPLEYQKDIINGLTSGLTSGDLFRLGVEMMAFILLSLALKWVLSYRSGIIGEWVIRRLRTVIYQNANTPQTSGEAGVEKGTLATMISAETEAVGKFVGNAFAEPILQVGTLISVIGYIAATQPRLGLIVMMIILPQVVIVVITQTRINVLVGARVLVLRRSINTITHVELAEVKQSVLDDFEEIYDARRRIFLWKLSNKFVLSALNGLGLVTVLVFGGWLVIEGRSDVGTVVAATVGLNRIQQPWRLLIAFYRNLSAVRVQFELMRGAVKQLEREQNPPASGARAAPGH
jgi:ABC-type multidrug transport system fused ATPase/permease subunit